MMHGYLKSILKGFNGAVLFDEPMSRHTSFRIGGPADVIVFPEDEMALSRLIRLTRAKKVSLFILGGGTNLLVRDKGIRGVVISLSSSLSGYCFKNIVRIKEEKSQVYINAGAGVSLPRLLKYTAEEGLSGVEFTAGIPGSLGGAIVMNAGSYGKEIRDQLDSIRIADRHGNIVDIPAKDITFRYRSAHIPGIAVIGAVLRLQRDDRGKVEKMIKENLLRKRETQSVKKPNAGSIFKNPEGPKGMKAWELIDSVRLRGASIGKASISERHTNFIVNNGSAMARDVMSLIKLAGNKVERKTGITLELEVRIVGT